MIPNDLSLAANWLPLVFYVLLGLSLLIYVILDGYDLGVGILLKQVRIEEKDLMIASIGPFWDANETWLVLAVGILLVAFPVAHGLILGWLYLPTVLLLIGLILRGVAFDFRVKAHAAAQPLWNDVFWAGSLLAALSQGYMLGLTILGFAEGWAAHLFALMIGVCLAAGYSLLGATWLIMKTEGALQLKAVKWARHSLSLTALGVLAVSIATPFLSQRVLEKWFTLPWLVLLLPIPIITLILFLVIARSLARLPSRLANENQYGIWVPFAASVGIFILAFYGLAYSIFPFLIIEKMTLWEAASSEAALRVILYGVVIVLPAIIGYTIFAYRIFWGKVTTLRYD
ncbi:cytochrome d ubiquinol oxidase subunit II [Parvibium lacunae]|uniref:Cytochrome d ubiquinol oxidase subunit II n=1 Tax=Parvibium lacunae TaxID=1888893 RepID=A0A368L730_9BURK|nr:cytochrome d ubiquinol oxidase subunit II [Parvibium lacunae]RCS59427.1 cytochrome d ubiquinol oxidase subunit II [Parvibium lacunae]